MNIRFFTAGVLMALSCGKAMAAETVFIGYRGDGTGVFPEDCQPVTTWKEFAGTRQTDDKKPRTVPDPTSPEVLENIVWKTAMPNLTESSPIVVGKLVFTLCEPGWPVGTGDAPSLVCVDGDSGKILWQKPVDQFDALPPAEQAEPKRLRALYWEQQRRAYQFLLRSQEVAQTKDAAKQEELAKEAEAAGFKGVAGKIRKPGGAALFAGQLGWGRIGEARGLEKYGFRLPQWAYTTLGVTFPTPCSDGRLVYAPSGFGCVAAFDLDGNRRWLTWFFEPKSGRKIEGMGACSPLLAENGTRLIWRTGGYIFGLDAATGAVVWEHQFKGDDLKPGSLAGNGEVGTGAVLNVGGQDIYINTRGRTFRAKDGKLLADPLLPEMTGMAHHSLVYDWSKNIVVFGTGGHSGRSAFGVPSCSYAIKVLPDGPDKVKAEILWQKTKKEVDGYIGDQTPVLYRGRLYLNAGPILDLMTGAKLGKCEVGGIHGLLAAGGCIWGMTANAGCDVPLARVASDGTPEKPVVHALSHLGPFDAAKLAQMAAYGANRKDTWYHWATARNYPFFSGNRVFIRTFDHLYCIGDKTKPFVPSTAFAAR